MSLKTISQGRPLGTSTLVPIATDSTGKTIIAGYDPVDDANRIKTVQKKFRDQFLGTSLSNSNWSEIGTKGTGTLVVSSGTLVVNSGTTASADFGIISKETFTIPFRVGFGLSMSQRIANSTLIVEAVSVDSSGNPDDQHVAAIFFDGVLPAQAKYRVKNGSLANLDSGSSTFPTTASAAVFEIEPFSDEVWFHGGPMDATNARSNSYRRHQQIPDPNATYKIRIRCVNGATAPASSTASTFRYIAVQDYTEITAEITAGRGQSVAGQSMGVVVTGGSISTSGTANITESSLIAPTSYILNSLATTNLVSVKATAGTMYGLMLSNVTATPAYLKLYNKASAPVLATDVPVHTIVIPANSDKQIDLGRVGIRFGTGIAIAITAAIAPTDTTAVAAGAVQTVISYI